MRLITARQAWHDSQHESHASIMQAAIEGVKSETKRTQRRSRLVDAVFAATGDEEEARIKVAAQKVSASETRRTGRDTSSARCIHMLTMGKVQSAIASLPKPLQHFGHFLYSPLSNVRDQDVARTLAWFKAELPEMSRVKESRAFCMVLPALQSYRGEVNGGRDEWGPARVATFVAEWYGEAINTSQWQRDWAPIWDVLKNTIGELDQKALQPVEVLIDGSRQQQVA